jgi:hypothetical protein
VRRWDAAPPARDHGNVLLHGVGLWDARESQSRSALRCSPSVRMR